MLQQMPAADGVTASKIWAWARRNDVRSCKLRKTIVRRGIHLSIIYYILTGYRGRAGGMRDGRKQGKG